ncbi:ATP-dependent endonuclease [Occultella aeris]|uniref:Vitamin B12-transporter ATPase n=1 Tax=Occultella aeris TaxID=2761496 RepID=A0A7M4DPM7_9MICO|nr:ATP-binding protein [Occultella aeris]VZO39421.1 vitamin B12-transporter ATPase [Occultella aeris]
MANKVLDLEINSLTFRSGLEIAIEEGVTVIVGPNNSGKSTLLRDMVNLLSADPNQPPIPGVVVERVNLTWSGDVQDQLEKLKESLRYYPAGTSEALSGYYESVFKFPNDNVIHESVVNSILKSSTTLGQLAEVYLLHFAAESRTGMVGPDASFDAINGMPSTPLQTMWVNRELEIELSRAVEESFGQGITVNRYAGMNIPLHYGKTSARETAPPLGEEYKEELRGLPLVNEQGDGLRSFIGLVLNILAGSHRLVLLDEPEAFLHPPQARNLGRLLVRLCQTGSRIIVATHSDDIVQGIASSAHESAPVAIHRITRSSSQNHVSSIPTDAVRDLYADPFMRYSSVLDGLFYHGVAVCESFGDCTYYRAVLDSLARTSPHVDIHFTQTGGKQRIASAVRSLRSAAVPVASVVDIDMLSNRTELKQLIDAHGGDIAGFDSRLRSVQAAVVSKGETVPRERLRSRVGPLLELAPKDLSPEEIANVRQVLQARSGWKQMKISGVALLNGDARAAIESIIDDLGALGIFIVPLGELESFHPAIGSRDKMAWLKQVMDERLHENEGVHSSFVEQIREYIAAKQLTPPSSPIP